MQKTQYTPSSQFKNLADRAKTVGVTVEQAISCVGETQRDTIAKLKEKGLSRTGEYRACVAIIRSIQEDRERSKRSAGDRARSLKYTDPLAKRAKETRRLTVGIIKEIRACNYLSAAEKEKYAGQIKRNRASTDPIKRKALALNERRYKLARISALGLTGALDLRFGVKKLTDSQLDDILKLPVVTRDMPTGETDCSLPLGEGRVLVIERPKRVGWKNVGSRYYPDLGSPLAVLYHISAEFGARVISKSTWARRGDWLAKIACKFGLPTAAKPEPGLGSSAWVERGTEEGVTCLRLLGGPVAIYRAESGGVSYHAKTPAAAKFGHARKLIKLRRNPGDVEVITRSKAAKMWGFCRAGIAEFCRAIGVVEGSITLLDLKERVKKAQNEGINLTPWSAELKTAGLI